MNKTKETFLTTSSIITIVASAFAILLAFMFFFMGSLFDEDLFKEIYREDSTLTYYEQADGSYYFTDEEDGVEIIIKEDEIEALAEIASSMFVFMGVLTLAFSIAKLVLAIRILIYNNKDKYSAGCVIALLVLSIMTMSLLESVFLIVAMCFKDKPIEENNKKLLGLEDIKIEDDSNQE